MSLSDFINIKTATAGAVIMGGMVFYVNYEFGLEAASIAAFKQAVYTFFFGGACVRISEVLSTKTRSKWAGVALGATVASATTISAVYMVHYMKGTPLPFASTLPTIIMAPPGFVVLAWYYRTKWETVHSSQ